MSLRHLVETSQVIQGHHLSGSHDGRPRALGMLGMEHQVMVCHLSAPVLQLNLQPLGLIHDLLRLGIQFLLQPFIFRIACLLQLGDLPFHPLGKGGNLPF